ncbi:MAG: DUF503 domain-containing protein [Dehalococcoidia bacterium]|jgi:hypothetical protein|nr:DUF503 domain-containing protein [Dehalococcoidia bacterium]|tara:strand:+ start:132 stop:425 length:294 start_codon:yes stop_codon:yes gene_type:complete
MSVGTVKVRLRLAENHSLKGKRQVVKSIIARVQNRFNVSIAEIEDQDHWQVATLGIACISNDGRQVNRVLSQVVEFIANSRMEAELVDHDMEILPGP